MATQSGPHSSVQYVEPNRYDNISTFTKEISVNGEPFNKIIDPENYCIGVSLTTSLCNRGFQVTDDKTAVTLNCDMTNSGSKVSFMSGKLVKAVNYDKDIPYLTTDYADMYVTDLQDFGTTEMIGIKSINIDFENAVLPVITIQFTDVRGMSLFTPKELSRLEDVPKGGDVTKDNVAQFFFQCFFKFPYPKFNITVKGFYGRPVSYEVTCDKFETNFNSETGNFDVTARFIGYKYSFLTDVSLELLEAAPYCDFLGKDYWEEKKQSDFQVTNVYGAKVPMPTLVEIRNKIKDILTNGDPEQTNTTITEEDNTHDEERRSLEEIKKTYFSWYEQLIQEANKKYSEKHVFIDKNDDGDYQRVIILIPSDYASDDMSQDYQQMPETQKVNNDLCALIKKYNEAYGQGNKLDEISEDFKGYVKTPLFNDLTTKDTFNGLVENCKIPEDVVKRMMLGVNKDTTLETVFNGGEPPQYTHCFDIDVDYSTIQSRINSLTEDANKSYLQKRKEKEIHDKNIKLIGELGFNPTVSNVTKIIMAHLETLMHMIYNVTDAIKNDSSRTPSAWGISCGKDGTCPDIDCNTTRIPPFPRVTEKVEESGITKQQDMWIGKLDKDSIKEVDLVETFFNAIEEIDRLITETDRKIEETKEARQEAAKGEERCVVKYPTTSFDFFLNSKLYGNDVVEDIDKLSGAISLRMFSVLCLNFYANQCGKNAWKNKAAQLGRVEAHNFVDSVNVETNPKLRDWIRLGTGELNADNIIKTIQSKEGKYPWSFDSGNPTAKPLFDSSAWLSRYQCNPLNVTVEHGYSYMYPVQNISFDKIKENYGIFSNGDSQDSKDVLMSCPSVEINSIDITSYNCHNSLIIENNVNKVKDMLDKAMSESVSSYTEVTNALSGKTTLEEAIEGYYSKIFKTEGLSSFCKKNGVKKGDDIVNYRKDSDEAFFVFLKDKKIVLTDKESSVTYTSTPEDLEQYFNNEVAAKSINSCFISEIFPYKGKEINHRDSLLNKDDFSAIEFLMGIDCIDYDYLRQHGGFNWMLYGTNAFVYTPRLVVLQLGAILATECGNDLNHKIDVNAISCGLPGNLKQIVSQYLNTISIYSRMALIKYYRDWENNEFKDIKAQLTGKNKNANIAARYYKSETGMKTVYTRVLLYEGSSFVTKLTNGLMLPVLVIHGNVNHFTCASKLEGGSYRADPTKYGRFTLPKSVYAVTNDVYKNYLNAFVDELNRILEVDYEKDENGNMVRRARNACNTSNEMRMELYRYLKQVYDKWIPSAKESDWNFKNFFEDEGGKGDYRFYFIDSYYNKIGDKLLINPRELTRRLDTARDNSDIGSSVYSLLGWIYGDNRCMFKCIQNFADFSNGDGIYDVFNPLPYSTAFSNLRQGSDFVVVYTYEPSKYLDLNSSEYTDDGFMLNDELQCPVSITSRGNGNGYYKIPAFGVTYGRQYQSYFKNISLDTKNAIQTQQAIFAKHAILNGKTSNNKFGASGQDLFDIYTTQSYTCTVDMMGCAWIQPMMYFVLLNVPMFRGSYMIMKVNHKIVPGDMTTTFTGCRMSNCANKFVQDIFISSEGDETQFTTDDNNFTRENDLANVDNDCPYAVYPIFDTCGEGYTELKKIIRKWEGEYAGNIDGETCTMRGVTLKTFRSVMGNNSLTCQDLRNITEDQWDKVFKKVCLDVWKWDKINNKSIANLLCDWAWGSGCAGITIPREVIGTSGGGCAVTDADVNAINSNPNQRDLFQRLWNRRKQHFESIHLNPKYYKQCGGEIGAKKCDPLRGWLNRLNDFHYFESPNTTQEEATKVNEDIYPLFYNAVKQTCENTSSMRFTPKEEYFKNTDARGNETKVLMMSTDANNTPKLAKLFDCILNTPEYFKYVTNLYWVYENDPKTIARVDVKLSNKEVATNNQHVWWYRKGTRAENKNAKPESERLLVDNLSEDAKRSLGKRYKNDGSDVGKFKAFVPELQDPQNLTAYTPTNCASVGSSTGSGSGTLTGYNGQIKPSSKLYTLLDVANNGYALDYMQSTDYPTVYAKKYGKGSKPPYVDGYGWKIYKNKYCGCCTSGPTTWYKRIGISLTWWNPKGTATSNHVDTSKWFRGKGFNLVWHGHLTDADLLPTSSFCPGDVATFHVYNANGKATSHGVMWTGKDWRSDCIQDRLSCYHGGKSGDRDGEYSVCIWRSPTLVAEGLGITDTPNLT